jgi:hypothetical protein
MPGALPSDVDAKAAEGLPAIEREVAGSVFVEQGAKARGHERHEHRLRRRRSYRRSARHELASKTEQNGAPRHDVNVARLLVASTRQDRIDGARGERRSRIR